MRVSISPGEPIRVTAHFHGAAGVREVEALLDTGSLFVTKRPGIASALGYSLDGAPRIAIVTANGVTEAPRITLSRVVVGEFALRDIPALCLDIDVAGATSLLGLSLLAHLNFSVDNKTRTLTITDP